MPRTRSSSGILNSGNLLAGINPVFAGWVVEPGTIADMVYEEFDRALTTHGNANAGATITYDLGSLQRILGITDNQYSDMITWGKGADDVWRRCTLNHVGVFAGVYRYIEIRSGAHADISYIKTIVYKI